MTAESAPAPRKSNKTALIIVSLLLGVVLLCVVLNVIGNNATGGTSPAPTVLGSAAAPPFQATILAGAYGRIVHTSSGHTETLDCRQDPGMTVFLTNGDSAFIPCPAESATLISLGADQLPAALSQDLRFISGMDVQVSPSLSGTMRVEFAPPDASHLSGRTIAHWNGAQWEYLPVERLSAVRVNTTGIFVFASK